jgi:hypothetical protein
MNPFTVWGQFCGATLPCSTTRFDLYFPDAPIENPWIWAYDELPPLDVAVELKKDYFIQYRGNAKLTRNHPFVGFLLFCWQKENGEFLGVTKRKADGADQWRYLTTENQAEKKTMNFQQAMQAYFEGKKVRPSMWDKDFYMQKFGWNCNADVITKEHIHGFWELFDEKAEERARVMKEIAECEHKLGELRRSL